MLDHVLDSSGFVPRAVCGEWTRSEVLLNNFSDLFIALAYVSIPIMLMVFARRRRDLPMSWITVVFAAFIFTCGATHVLEIILFYEPVYRLAGWVKFATALASWSAVFALFRILPFALTLRSPRELEALNQALQAEIEKRRRTEAKLQTMLHKLRDNDQLKDEFMANVSHELRTPLTLILAPVEHVMEQESINAQERRMLRTVQTNALRLLDQVNSLLDFSKVSAGKLEIHREPTPIVEFAFGITNEFRRLAMRQDKTIDFQPQSDERVLLDRYLFERILFNLLSNALKFSPSGGQVLVELEYTEPFLLLRVSDDGPGIPEKAQASLFERFRTVDGRSTRRQEGTGLGLSLVKEFASVLGGEVGVQSSPGRGSRFWVKLLAPRTDQEAKPSHVALQLAHVGPLEELPMKQLAGVGLGELKTRHEARVLVAEDNPELAQYFRLLLQGLAEVRVVRDGKLAESTVREWRPHLVLSDVMMPGQDGFALCRKIKQDDSLQSTQVVLVTALTHREALLKGWEAGADEYLFKPFHPTELVTRVRSLLTNLTARRALEDELRETNSELEDRVASRSRDLLEKNEELKEAVSQAEQANLVKSRFLANLSHELRTPMFGILGLSELATDMSEEEMLQSLQQIHRAARSLDALLVDLLEFSKLEAGKMTLRPEPFKLSILIEELMASLELFAEEQQVVLHAEVDPRLEATCFDADGARLRYVLMNLTQNGLKYTCQGRVTVRIRCLEDREQEMTVCCEVEDTGVGIPTEEMDRIMEPFSQLENPLTKTAGGAGLGLAICRELLDLFGSRLQVESELGIGSTFSFEVMLKKVAEKARVKTVGEDGTTRGLRILLVEDNPINRRVVTKMLEMDGHQVVSAPDGMRALEILRDMEFDIAFLDLQIPELDGVSLARKIRGELGLELPLIAFTAHGEEHFRKLAMEAGMNDFLVKPAPRKAIVEVLNRSVMKKN
jgi:signal transduction histidine kinase